jgi:undecaprenyl diphosphate synthase
MAIFKTNDKSAEQEILPRHIAIIMDGNGRWAKKRGLPRTAGHAAGAETYRRIATLCSDMGIEYLTVYAFSTENWKRSQNEVEAIMGLFKKYLNEAVETMEQKNVSLKVFGDTSVLSPELQELIRKTAEISKRVTGMQANICVNYGGRDEIIRAAKKWAEDPNRGELTEEVFSRYMFSAGVPDPDLIIRPSGEIRTSNFLLWQSAYSEYYFTDVLWPDFDEAELMKAIDAYRKRDRRFGGVK